MPSTEDIFSLVSPKPSAADMGGRVLFCRFHGEDYAFVWAAGDGMRELVQAQYGTREGEGGEAFAFEAAGLEVHQKVGEPPLPDGLYVGRLAMEDFGAESWEMPHVRDVGPVVRDVRPATKEEWHAHLRNEWPWEECGDAR